MENPRIDHGTAFDWGRASADYARYRDIYPAEFYAKLLELGVGRRGQAVLDLGTGTGVLPRHLYAHGAAFTGVDISPEQVAEARRLAREAGQAIDFRVAAAEEADFPDNAFDAATACQCFEYFDAERLVPLLKRWLKPGGLLAICHMDWLADHSDIARRSADLVLRFSPRWTGAALKRERAEKPAWADAHGFALVRAMAFETAVPFTRESWNGRMKACRGVGASLPPAEVERFGREHLALLERLAPDAFAIPHLAMMVLLENGKSPE